MTENRDFKGVWIPKEIWLNEDLTMIEKVVLIEIDSLDNEEGCVASNEYLANFCQCSETKVSTAISKLIKMNYIYQQSFNGRIRILKSRLSKFERQTFTNCKAGIQKVKDNNIKNNTNNNKEDKNKNNKKENNISDVVSSVEDEDLRNVLKEFIKMRSTIKKPLTAYGLNLIINKLNKITPNIEEQIQVVEQSIERCWQGVFPLQKDTKQDSFTKFAQLAQDYNYEE